MITTIYVLFLTYFFHLQRALLVMQGTKSSHQILLYKFQVLQ